MFHKLMSVSLVVMVMACSPTVLDLDSDPVHPSTEESMVEKLCIPGQYHCAEDGKSYGLCGLEASVLQATPCYPHTRCEASADSVEEPICEPFEDSGPQGGPLFCWQTTITAEPETVIDQGCTLSNQQKDGMWRNHPGMIPSDYANKTCDSLGDLSNPSDGLCYGLCCFEKHQAIQAFKWDGYTNIPGYTE